MISTNPSVADIDATMNLLSVLELAKDAAALKKAVSQIKQAQDDAAAERKAADAEIAKAKANAAEVSVQQGLIEQEKARMKEELARMFKTSEELESARVAMRDERNRFDSWMAQQREALAAAQAKVDSDAAANVRRAEDLKAIERAAAAREQAASDALRSADAKRTEYEQKMAALKQMVS